MITGFSIATLVLFIFSIFFVIYPISIPFKLPGFHRRRHIYLNLTTAPIIAIAILWASQCLGPKVIRDGIVGTDGVKPYNILILFFSLAYMAITLDITGVLRAAAFWVSNKGGTDGYKLFLYFYMMLTALSVVLGNDPVILSGTVFLVYYTTVTQLNPTSWLMSEFAAANTASMVLFVGNPTNVVICEGFSVNNAAFTAYTILPFIGCSLACFVALGFQFRGSKYIPRRLVQHDDLDVRSALLDPISAWVGSILLGTCLVVIIVVSFFHVDVWKISLPFAVAKFIYDIAWDHYRRVMGIPILLEPPKWQISEVVVLPPSSHDVAMRSIGKEGFDTPEKQPSTDDSIRDRRTTPPTITFEEISQLSTSIPTAASNTRVNTRSNTENTTLTTQTLTDEPRTIPPTITFEGNTTLTTQTLTDKPRSSLTPNTLKARLLSSYISKYNKVAAHFPTLFTALPRLPFALVPFAFSQFILIEGLTHQGWIEIFANWLVRASNRQMFPVIWLVGVLGVILCNISGTNIGATILLTKVVRAADLPDHSNRAAAIALAVASNIGAVSFTYSASLAGLLWQQILQQKEIIIKQREFAYWNTLPLLVMTAVGLGIVCAEMAVLY